MNAPARRGARAKLTPLEVMADKVHLLADCLSAAGVADARREEAAQVARAALRLPPGHSRRLSALRRCRIAVQRAASANLRLKHATESLMLLLERRARREREASATA